MTDLTWTQVQIDGEWLAVAHKPDLSDLGEPYLSAVKWMLASCVKTEYRLQQVKY